MIYVEARMGELIKKTVKPRGDTIKGGSSQRAKRESHQVQLARTLLVNMLKKLVL